MPASPPGEIDTVLLAMCDMQGRLQGKRLTAGHFLDEVVEHGAEGCNYLLAVDVEMNTVDGYEMSSWETGYGDFALVPDLDTLRLVPWQEATALVMCDLRWADGSDVAASPRQVLRGQLARLASHGWSANASTELEFMVFKDSYESAWHKGFRRPRAGQPLQRRLLTAGDLADRAADPAHPQRDGRRRARGGELQGRVQLRSARDQLQVRRRAARRRRAHDLQERGQGDRRPGGDGDQLHGQVRPARGQLLPRPLLAGRRRQRRDGVRREPSAVRRRSWPASCTVCASSRCCWPPTSTPTSGSPRARSPRPRSRGPTTTARARYGSSATARACASRTAPAARTSTPTWRSRR